MSRLTARDRETVAEVAFNNGVVEAELVRRVEATMRDHDLATAAYDAACREAGLMTTDPAFPHSPDLNPNWTPLVAQRLYACAKCGAQKCISTNHTGTVWSERCIGTCRQISNPHTAREIVQPYHGPHRYLGPWTGELEPDSRTWAERQSTGGMTAPIGDRP